ncbi:MAG: ribose 5-phosphate isomerase B [Candidatus Neomarinimicrobiota bacterium]|nr:ribose 5-phosphate isomerase B [Candidatus Neomarinimicrobiota bacterium]RKY49180.1 MAG: ribose 5-phosphate isomerase B [Candidatus Neomarinimicrobiota bacterium]RKY50563.1 MAG: ribose 5-phosphate isomerase B [Candidatus Neomarinimicrobiota bacterium]HDN58936.1 ribose 5-phosphate isomerase B [Candidatus Neomarinimicrobiota bacterium]
MKVVIGCDHGGVELKEYLKAHLQDNIEIIDVGTDTKKSVDYPDFAFKVGTLVSLGRADFGILICRTGVGMSIAANKITNIRAALCHCEKYAELARCHNDANVLCLGADFTEPSEAVRIARKFLSTEFLGGRHFRRVKKIISREG